MKKGFLFVLVLALVSGMCLSFMPTPALATDTDDQTTASVATGNTTVLNRRFYRTGNRTLN